MSRQAARGRGALSEPESATTVRARREIVEAVVEMLREVAGQFDNGTRVMISAPDALRQVALEITAVTEAYEDMGR